MNAHQPVLVIGGTRGTGLLIARLLHRQGHRVRVLARDRDRALTLFDQTVQVVDGDVTKPETLRPAIDGVRQIVFTAGCRSGHPVREPQVKAVGFEGVLNTLAAARQLGFTGRFLYLNSSGLLDRLQPDVVLCIPPLPPGGGACGVGRCGAEAPGHCSV